MSDHFVSIFLLLCCWYMSFKLKQMGKKKNAYKRSQRHLPNVSVSEWKTCCDLESGCVKGWVSLVYSVMCLPVGLWRLLRLWPERRQSSSAWLAHVANGRSSVSSGSIVRPPRSRVSLYDIYQPPFCLSISQRQLSSCWGFPVNRLSKMIFKPLRDFVKNM